MYLEDIYESQFLAIPNAECFVLLCSVVIEVVLICNTSLKCSSDVRCGPKNVETLLSLEKTLNESHGVMNPASVLITGIFIIMNVIKHQYKKRFSSRVK